MSMQAALAFAGEQVWAIRRATFDAQITALEMGGAPLAAPARRSPAQHSSSGNVGVLPIIGPITYRPDVWQMYFGGCCITDLRVGLKELVEDPGARTIVLHLDSPGGTITGLVEFAAELRAARAVKRVVAVIDQMCCSAAYWLACQADDIFITPSCDVGSVGCFLCHIDVSKLNDRIGIVPTYIYSGQFKIEGHSGAPLPDAAKKHLQQTVDDVHTKFVNDIVKGRGRGLTPAGVRREFGEGRVVSVEDALRYRMVDRMFTTPTEAFGSAQQGVSRAVAAEHEAIRIAIGQAPSVTAAEIDAINISVALGGDY